ncbi:hypothetical protein [Saccharothrix hoggarensis]|uniref:Uncharacterized protein n=1 Tax=Saccharothrix hoggarensis TaxID=913853 RepID=A0ABW3QR39_9PSEU
MTAIPADHDSATLVLICDHCGRAYDSEDAHTVWRLLWTSAVGDGWRGRDRAIGPHWCRRCAA